MLCTHWQAQSVRCIWHTQLHLLELHVWQFFSGRHWKQLLCPKNLFWVSWVIYEPQVSGDGVLLLVLPQLGLP